MDFQYYVNILLRRKWAILLTALLAAVLAYFLANSLPPTYSTEATLETGVLNYDGSSGGDGFVQEYQINARFENLIQEFRSEKMLRLESFRLLVHDLDESNIPFTNPDKKTSVILSDDEVNDLLLVLKQKYKKKNTALSAIYAHNYNKLAKAYEYDYKSLRKILEVSRSGKTDYLKVKATSSNPAMAAFFVNNLCQDFIDIDAREKFSEQDENIAYREADVLKKKNELDSISLGVRNYMRNHVLTNLPQESKLLVSNRTELENKRSEAETNVAYLTDAIASVKLKISSIKNEGSAGQSRATNASAAIAKLKRQISDLRSEWVSGGRKNKKLGAKIQVLEEQKLLLIQSSAKHFVSSNQTDSNQEEELERTLLNLEIKKQKAEQAAMKYASAVGRITSKIPMMANNRATVEAMEAEKERVSKQYRDAQDDLRTAKAGKTYQKEALKITQNASIPEESQSNKAMFVSAFSGVGGGALASMLIFLLAFFDNKLTNVNQFKQLVKLPLLGTLPFVKKGLIPGRLFVEDNDQLLTFKESLRSLRYGLEESGEEVFLVTSMQNKDGKSFAIGYLVEALAANGKKVLVIDTNFRNNTLSEHLPKGTMRFGIILQKLIAEYDLQKAFLIQDDGNAEQIAQFDLIGNTGISGTPMEVLSGKDFGSFLEELIELYDIIFIEGAPLANYSDTKELEQYADKLIGVFASNGSLDAKDKEAISYLKSLGDKYLGSILNGVDPKNYN